MVRSIKVFYLAFIISAFALSSYAQWRPQATIPTIDVQVLNARLVAIAKVKASATRNAKKAVVFIAHQEVLKGEVPPAGLVHEVVDSPRKGWSVLVFDHAWISLTTDISQFRPQSETY
jgi:hypothetical protein